MPYNDIPVDLIPKIQHGRLDRISLAELGAYIVSLAQGGILHDSPELREYTHERAQLPIPPTEEVQKQMDEEKRLQEEASQQKIAPLSSQKNNNALPSGGKNTDSQKATQDKVPVKTKK
jgi:hypothetical protein